LDATRVRATVVLPYLVLHLVVGRERRGVTLDLRVVDEEVFARRTDEEPVALLRVEPFDAPALSRRPVGVFRLAVEGSLHDGPDPDGGCRRGSLRVGLEHYRVLGHLDGHRLHANPMLFPDGVFGDGRVQPQPPAVAFPVVEDALEDALWLAGTSLAAVDVVAGAERLHRRGACTKGVGDPVVRLAVLHPLPDLLHVRF
jgi:hypothetical protein